jgi:Fic family protein
MERLIEDSKEDYYDILEKCSAGWHDGENELLPWWNYFLSIIHRAYHEFAERVENAESMGKAELVRHTITRQIGDFTLAELQAECPSVSNQLIKKVLSELKNDGKVKLSGHGRGAKWTLTK